MGSDETILDLAQRLSFRTGVPQHLFCLVQQSKVLPGSRTLARAGISSDSHVHICGRLRGGAGGGRVQIEGEWNCQACGMVECWPTKRQCFRCGNPRYVRNGGAVGGKPRGPPRDQNAFGRPPPTPSTGDPTHRLPRKGAPQNKGTAPHVPVAGGDMSLLISVLQTIWLPQEFMSQVEAKLAPPRQKKSSDEKAPALAKAKLDRVVAQKNKLNRTVAYHATKLRESEELLAAETAELVEVETEYRAASSKRFSPTQSVAASVEPQSDPEPETDGMSHDRVFGWTLQALAWKGLLRT